MSPDPFDFAPAEQLPEPEPMTAEQYWNEQAASAHSEAAQEQR